MKKKDRASGVSGDIFAGWAHRRIAYLEKRNQKLVELLSMVTIEGMGGTPDLFGPDGGWDAFDERTQALLKKKS